jgi:hypothetical protein
VQPRDALMAVIKEILSLLSHCRFPFAHEVASSEVMSHAQRNYRNSDNFNISNEMYIIDI